MYTSKIQEIQEQARRLPEGGGIGHAAAGALHSPVGKGADQPKVEASRSGWSASDVPCTSSKLEGIHGYNAVAHAEVNQDMILLMEGFAWGC